LSGKALAGEARSKRAAAERLQQKICPGMTATIEAKTGRRRIITYLLSPLLRRVTGLNSRKFDEIGFALTPFLAHLIFLYIFIIKIVLRPSPGLISLGLGFYDLWTAYPFR
jgi:hypothetical protein